MKILFVCLGNICRSPLAEGIMKYKSMQMGISIEVDSAGTGSWHIGEPPDSRGVVVALKHGIDISGQRARKVHLEDFDLFDYIIAMDKSNYSELLGMARDSSYGKKVKLFMGFAYENSNLDVPDPYYDNKFEEVFELLDNAIEKIILNLNNQLS